MCVDIGDKRLLHSVSVSVAPGEVVVVAGPNGAGKTTLLRVLSGELTPTSGTAHVQGRPVGQVPAAELARLRAVLPQSTRIEFGFSSREVVAMGRAPWRGRPEARADDELVERSLHAVDAAHLADRAVVTLSGGETARVTLARVLAQSTGVLLLDEPTAALDIRHQAMVLDAACRRAREGAAVLAILHDLNAAARVADRVVLMRDGAVAADGAPGDVLRAAVLSDVYDHPIDVFDIGGRARPVIVPAEPALA